MWIFLAITLNLLVVHVCTVKGTGNADFQCGNCTCRGVFIAGGVINVKTSTSRSLIESNCASKGLTSFPINIDRDLDQSLYKIDLSHNSLDLHENINCQNLRTSSLCKRWPNIASVSLAHIGLQHIGCIFQGCQALNNLDLSGNRLQSIEASTFKDIESLEYLNLTGNQLKSTALAFPASLRTLVLSRNSLEKLHTNVLTGLSALEWIDLSYNKIKIIESGAFSSLPRLRKIYLNNNHIRHLNSIFVSDLPSLEWLDLSHNSLTEIPEGISRAAITDLILDENSISELDSAALGSMQNLEWLYVRDNPVHCDCEDADFLHLLRRVSVEGRCASPDGVENSWIEDSCGEATPAYPRPLSEVMRGGPQQNMDHEKTASPERSQRMKILLYHREKRSSGSHNQTVSEDEPITSADDESEDERGALTADESNNKENHSRPENTSVAPMDGATEAQVSSDLDSTTEKGYVSTENRSLPDSDTVEDKGDKSLSQPRDYHVDQMSQNGSHQDWDTRRDPDNLNVPGGSMEGSPCPSDGDTELPAVIADMLNDTESLSQWDTNTTGLIFTGCNGSQNSLDSQRGPDTGCNGSRNSLDSQRGPHKAESFTAAIITSLVLIVFVVTCIAVTSVVLRNRKRGIYDKARQEEINQEKEEINLTGAPLVV